MPPHPHNRHPRACPEDPFPSRPGHDLTPPPIHIFADCTSRAYTSRDCFSAASMKLANSGCGSNGFDFSSG